MIPQNAITAWRNVAPWGSSDQIVFNQDIRPLLSVDQISQYHVEKAYDLVKNRFLIKLHGDPWQETL